MTTSMPALPWNAWATALPVSPEVATSTWMRVPSVATKASIAAARNCAPKSLKAQVGPWKSSSSHRRPSSLRSAGAKVKARSQMPSRGPARRSRARAARPSRVRRARRSPCRGRTMRTGATGRASRRDGRGCRRAPDRRTAPPGTRPRGGGARERPGLASTAGPVVFTADRNRSLSRPAAGTPRPSRRRRALRRQRTRTARTRKDPSPRSSSRAPRPRARRASPRGSRG